MSHLSFDALVSADYFHCTGLAQPLRKDSTLPPLALLLPSMARHLVSLNLNTVSRLGITVNLTLNMASNLVNTVSLNLSTASSRDNSRDNSRANTVIFLPNSMVNSLQPTGLLVSVLPRLLLDLPAPTILTLNIC